MQKNILNLPAYTVTAVDADEHDYRIKADVKQATVSCPTCESSKLVGFGRRERLIRDLPIRDKRVGIYVNSRRMQCRGCNKTFCEVLPDVDERRAMTNRLLEWMGKQSIKQTFASIAAEVGCHEATVRGVFADYVIALEATNRFETPTWMGIDEIDLIKPRCVVVNIKHNTLVGLLSDNSKETMLDYLSGLGELSQVQFAFINLSQAHKEAVQTMLPQARIVVHKAHVIKMANDAFNRARKTYRETLTPQQRRGLMHDRVVLLKREQDLTDDEARLLSEWASKHLWIGDAYRVKEEFHKIYDANTPDDAQERFTHWEHSIPPDVRPAFSGLIKVWRTWQPAILAHFDMPASISPSAEHCAECLSGLQDVVGRLGRGYSFEALRAKLLFADDAFMQTAHDDASGKSINYGTGIATLTRMIESGEL